MENEYYTPEIGQFVEGFKYETKETLGISMMDFSKPEEYTEPKMKDYWVEHTVPNLEPVRYPYTFKNGNDTITIFNGDGMYNDPLQTIKMMIENGNIRAKR